MSPKLWSQNSTTKIREIWVRTATKCRKLGVPSLLRSWFPLNDYLLLSRSFSSLALPHPLRGVSLFICAIPFLVDECSRAYGYLLFQIGEWFRGNSGASWKVFGPHKWGSYFYVTPEGQPQLSAKFNHEWSHSAAKVRSSNTTTLSKIMRMRNHQPPLEGAKRFTQWCDLWLRVSCGVSAW